MKNYLSVLLLGTLIGVLAGEFYGASRGEGSFQKSEEKFSGNFLSGEIIQISNGRIQINATIPDSASTENPFDFKREKKIIEVSSATEIRKVEIQKIANQSAVTNETNCEFSELKVGDKVIVQSELGTNKNEILATRLLRLPFQKEKI
ncbi:MAG: hypothetical protein ABL958_13650 [Bdellovibrionia bacterium]